MILRQLKDVLETELCKPYVDLTLTCRLDSAIRDVEYCYKQKQDPIPVLEKYHGRAYDLVIFDECNNS